MEASYPWMKRFLEIFIAWEKLRATLLHVVRYCFAHNFLSAAYHPFAFNTECRDTRGGMYITFSNKEL